MLLGAVGVVLFAWQLEMQGFIGAGLGGVVFLDCFVSGNAISGHGFLPIPEGLWLVPPPSMLTSFLPFQCPLVCLSWLLSHHCCLNLVLVES